MKFRNVYGVRIPEGGSYRIRVGGETMWTRHALRYVSLGDSIAAGQAINARWETEYGVGSQYGEGGNTSTAIVPGSYADLIRNDFMAAHGADTAELTSFAHSGDTVTNLLERLSETPYEQNPMRKAIANATLVTVCIGANDILVHVTENNLRDYATSGSLEKLETAVKNSLRALPSKYRTLFYELTKLNPNADVVFTTIYNPYKYLWIEEGQNGFFKPVLDAVPSGIGIDLGFVDIDITAMIKDSILNTDPIKLLFSRINGLDAWVETYVNRLNDILREQITAYQAINPHFKLADTKAVFDPVPDRTVTAEKHYDELVNVEYTRGFDIAEMDWGQLYEADGSAYNYWYKLIRRYVSGVNVDLAGMAAVLVDDILPKVILPDIDPHPEAYGQYALSKSFEDTLGWSALPRRTITYQPGRGTGTMPAQSIIALDNNLAMATIKDNAFGIPEEGYYFTGWSGSNNTTYTGGQRVGLRGDLELTAGWDNTYTVVFRLSKDSAFHGSGDTGPMECYALWIEGEEQADLGAFSNPPRTYRLPYGTNIGVVAQTKSGDARSYITYNGQKVAGTSSDARYGFTLVGNTDINFEWTYWVENLIYPQSYWNCYIETR